MRRAERLFRLVNEMRSREVCRADELAEQFEVSVRTIYRDIAHLQGSGLPIEGEAGVGYLLRPGFDLPNVTFTYDQIDALAIGLSFVETIGDPTLSAAAKAARAKLQASLPQPEDRKLADAPYYSLQRKGGSAGAIESIRQAIREQRMVEITYQDAEGKGSSRAIRPLVVWDFTDGWMFSAWCELRQDFRTFRMDRISSLTLTDIRFDNDPAKGLQAFLAQEDCR